MFRAALIAAPLLVISSAFEIQRARHALLGVLILPLLIGCRVPVAIARLDCSERPGRAVPYDSTAWSKLVGSFTLVTVTTSQGPAVRVERSFQHHDTLPSYQRRFRREGLRRQYGPLSVRPHRGVEQTRFRGEPWREPAEVEGTVLYTGAREGDDVSPSAYEILHISRAGFWGRWRNGQTGILRAVDRQTGLLLPDPAGYFCALRR